VAPHAVPHGGRAASTNPERLDPVPVSKIAGHSNVTMTLNTYADEFDRAHHRDDLFARIDKAGFGSA
jgi:integrase